MFISACPSALVNTKNPAGAHRSATTRDGEQAGLPLTDAHSPGLPDAVPSSTWWWCHRRQHRSGLAWPATVGDHLRYDSRLDLRTAGAETAEHPVIAQPLWITDGGRKTQQADANGVRS